MSARLQKKTYSIKKIYLVMEYNLTIQMFTLNEIYSISSIMFFILVVIISLCILIYTYNIWSIIFFLLTTVVIVGLNYSTVTGMGRAFIFDNNDHSGSSLISLFKDKTYTFVNHDGVEEIKLNGPGNIVTDPSKPGVTQVKIIAFTSVIAELESQDVVITSSGQPIDRSPAYGSNNTNLFIHKV